MRKYNNNNNNYMRYYINDCFGIVNIVSYHLGFEVNGSLSTFFSSNSQIRLLRIKL